MLTPPYLQVVIMILESDSYSWYGNVRVLLPKDEQGNTLLHRVAMYNDTAMMEYLLNNSRPGTWELSQMVRNLDGKTPFDVAPSYEMRYLIRHGRLITSSMMFQLRCKVCLPLFTSYYLLCCHLVDSPLPVTLIMVSLALKGYLDLLHLMACVTLMTTHIWSGELAGDDPALQHSTILHC